MILVVDDEPDVRVVLGKALENDGFAVATAADGEEALAITRELVPSLIVLDLRMPKMDGFEFDRARRRQPSTSLVPVVVVTAHDERETVEKVLRPAALVPKPFDPDEVRELAKRLVRPGTGVRG